MRITGFFPLSVDSIGTLFLLAILAPGLAGCGSGAKPDPSKRSNVLIIVVDSLRADRLGCYGYARETSPAIDGLARDPDAVLFRRHYAQGASTKISTASLLTGLYPFQHGVIWGHEMKERPNRAGLYATQTLSDDFETMAERLGNMGLSTFGVAATQHLVPEYGFSQGFTEYLGTKHAGNDGKRIKKTIQLIGRREGPFFGYLHLAGAHQPFREKDRHPAIMEKYGFEYDEKDRAAAGVDFTTVKTGHAIKGGRLTLEPDDERFLNVVYDAKVRHADGKVGKLLREMRNMERYDDTLIILTADHGEELYDHQGFAHGHALWDEVIHVPLIVKFPRGGKPSGMKGVIEGVTQAVDILPSLLSFFGRELPQELPGRDIFLGDARGTAYSETRRDWALIEERYKLIVGKDEVFLADHLSDSGEKTNLAEVYPEKVAAMKAAARKFRDGVAVKARDALVIETRPGEEAIRDLRTLGYIQ